MRNILATKVPKNLLEVIKTIENHRPIPLRAYDQIHMRTTDIALHLSLIAEITAGKRVIFIGDSDGVAMSLAYAGSLGIIPAPAECILCDFDERVIGFVDRLSRQLKFSDAIDSNLYNVFDPLPTFLIEAADCFHTNPPYGQYNQGKSIMAFVERGIAAVKEGGQGIIVLANDNRYTWTQPTLKNIFQFLVSKGVTPYRILDRLHRYHLDDQPNLESGLILCRDLSPKNALSPFAPLPDEYRYQFYGRRSDEVPHYVRETPTGHVMDWNWSQLEKVA